MHFSSLGEKYKIQIVQCLVTYIATPAKPNQRVQGTSVPSSGVFLTVSRCVKLGRPQQGTRGNTASRLELLDPHGSGAEVLPRPPGDGSTCRWNGWVTPYICFFCCPRRSCLKSHVWVMSCIISVLLVHQCVLVGISFEILPSSHLMDLSMVWGHF